MDVLEHSEPWEEVLHMHETSGSYSLHLPMVLFDFCGEKFDQFCVGCAGWGMRFLAVA